MSQPIPEPFVATWGFHSLVRAGTSNANTGTSTAWSSANRILYYPFYLPWPYNVRRVFWTNGATASGNVDFGIYSWEGVRLYSTGSTAQSGTNTRQYVTPGTDLLLPPGPYFWGHTHSNATGTYNMGSESLATGQIKGVKQEDAGAFGLPATATFGVLSATAFPVCGMTFTASGHA